MTPDKQDAPSEWVEEAMRLSSEGADAAWDAGAAGPYESMRAPHAKARDDKLAALRAHLEAKEREHQSDREVTIKVCNEMGALQAQVKQLAEALAGERHMRNLGQQPDVHWESLRDMRRAACEATDTALAAYQEKT